MDDKIYDLFQQAISGVQEANDKEKPNDTVRIKPAKVWGYDSDTGKATVYFLDDSEQNTYTLINKTGEVLYEGDTVKVYYTTNPAKGWVGMRSGTPERTSSGGSIEPIVSIAIYSNIDFQITTNAGTERYIAEFDEASSGEATT